eukprot:scaffold104315_cov75-Phaeocystis_antarctica.AAC.1
MAGLPLRVINDQPSKPTVLSTRCGVTVHSPQVITTKPINGVVRRARRVHGRVMTTMDRLTLTRRSQARGRLLRAPWAAERYGGAAGAPSSVPNGFVPVVLVRAAEHVGCLPKPPSDLGVLPKGFVDLAAMLPSQRERVDDDRQAPGEHRGEDAHQMRLAPAGWPAQERIHAVKHAEHALLLIASGKRPLSHSRPCRRQAAQAASCSARSPQHAPDVLQLVLDGRVPHRHGLYQYAEMVLVDAELGHMLLEARFGAAHRAVKQAVHSVPTTVSVEFLSEKCRGSTSDPMDAFFSIAILTGLRSRAPRW